MKKIIISTLIATLTISSPAYAYAYPQYSAETQKLLQEAGIEYNVPLDEVMRRQENYKKNKANKSTPSQNTVVKSTNTQVNPAIPNQDKEKSWGELRINSNYSNQVYYNPDHGSRMEGFDEFRYVWELN